MIDFLLNILSVSFELLIYFFFFRHFFGKPRFTKPVMALCYLLVGMISLCLSLIDVSDMLQRIGYITVIIGLALCYHGQIFIKLFVPFLFQAIGMMTERCCYLLLSPVREALQNYGAEWQSFEYFIGIILSNLIILLILRLLCSYKEYMFLQKEDIQFPFYFPILFLFPLMILFIIDQLSLLAVKAGAVNVATVLAVLLLTMITIVFFFGFDGLLKAIHNRQQMELLHKKLEQEQEYHTILLNKHQQFQELRHDTRKHFETVAGLLKNGHASDALAYAQQQSGKLALTSAVQTGVPLLDTILTIKAEQARQVHAKFESYVSVQVTPNSMALDDLASLLSNALDNALEAVQKIELLEQRKIWCRLVQDGKYLHITVRNTVAQPVTIIDNTVATTKADKRLHGFGVNIIKRMAKKYNGSYQLNCAHNVFTLQVMLLLNEEDAV